MRHRRCRHKDVEEALTGKIHGFLLDALHLPFPHHRDGDVDELAHHRLHIAAVVAHLGVLGGLHLDERRLNKLRQPPGDLGLPDAGGPNHNDVLRRDLVGKVSGQLQTPPAVPDRDRNASLRVVLADDVLVEFVNDPAGGEIIGHLMTSKTMLLLE